MNGTAKRDHGSAIVLVFLIFIAVTVGRMSDLNRNVSERIWTEVKNPHSILEIDSSSRPLTFVPLVNAIDSAVVNINTYSTAKEEDDVHHWEYEKREKGVPYGDLFNNFNGKKNSKYYQRISLGSGFIINKSGYILTNNHVIQSSTRINVTLSDTREFEAKIIGRDPDKDVALLKIYSGKDLPFVTLGNSDKAEVGEWVVAIGNPFGLGHTVTAGIVSAKGRLLGMGTTNSFIQTDAPINQGNSGGPLLNINGEVVGINSAIIANGTGIGFAIPINSIKQSVAEMASNSRLERSWIGVRIQPVDKLIAKSFGVSDEMGALVGDVAVGTSAERAGIKTGDIIINYGGNIVSSCRDLYSLIEKSSPGKPYPLTVFREGKTINMQITPVELSRNFLIRSSGNFEDRMGIVVTDLNPLLAKQFKVNEPGVIVESVGDGGIGYKARVMEGDVILEINTIRVKDSKEFSKVLKELSSSNAFIFLVIREGKGIYLSTDGD